jgi:hypothetical protein
MYSLAFDRLFKLMIDNTGYHGLVYSVNQFMNKWITQAEAARMRGVTRQAISRLIKRGKLQTIEFGGHLFVSLTDVTHFTSEKPGRPRKSEMTSIEEIKKQIGATTKDERAEIFQWLRVSHSIHPLEKEFGAPAEVILEAISRSSDLTKRGIRGIIAEAAFKINVLGNLVGWREDTPPGDHSYDFMLKRGEKTVSIQVKMQRLKAHRPMTANEGYRRLSGDYFVVETQRTRGGKDTSTGEDTRPYRFGEFDILAVAMHPSTGKWEDFRYTVGDWLIPHSDHEKLLLKFQPVAAGVDDDWTDSLETCIKWLLDGKKKTIKGVITPK